METPKLAALAKPLAAVPKPEPAPAATPEPGTRTPRNATPAPPPPSTTGKWLAEQQPKWLAAFAREVTAPFEKSAGDLQRQYRAALEDQLAAATRDARLDAAVAFRAELKLLADPGIPPTDESALLPALKTMRAAYRKTLATFEAERIAKAKIVHARSDTILAQNQTLLTQHQRLDEALEMKACREKLAAAWLQPPPSPSERAIAVATKEQPFVNSLGMKFVPLRPSAGLARRSRLLFAVWPARVGDFRAFVKASSGKFDYEKGEMAMILKSNGWWTRGWDYGWSNPGFEQTEKHPVVCVSWEDARAFCLWLTAKENLPPGWSYRMPTDAEWNEAVGLTQPGEGARENRRKADGYPWGTAWPPPNGAGNFAGEEARASDRPLDWAVLEGYRDKFPYTAPVGTFSANALGIADLAGNVRQWCEDASENRPSSRSYRGSSWCDAGNSDLLSAHRRTEVASHRGADLGFRCVLAEGATSAAPAPPPAVESAAAPAKFRYAYSFDDPGYRVWMRTGDAWEEKPPSGEPRHFRTVGRDTISGSAGSVLQSQEIAGFEVFVSDRGSSDPHIYFRQRKGSWKELGRMEDVE